MSTNVVSTKNPISNEDLPSLFIAADDCSKKAQKNYINLMRFNLILMVVSAVLAAISVSNASLKAYLSISTAFLLVVSIVLTFVIRVQGYERTWYDCRAISESVKTLSWRYMICAFPFSKDRPQDDVDKEFLDQLDEVIRGRQEMAGTLGSLASKPQISDKMRDIRKADTKERKQIYLFDRIKDQINWYSIKSKHHKDAGGTWFVAVVAVQIIALLASMFYIFRYDSTVRITGVLTTLASVFLAWLQTKRHQELAQSYSIAAQELGFIEERSRFVSTEEDLSSFVNNSEQAISREHTLWVARSGKK